jgi:hypothetical protein
MKLISSLALLASLSFANAQAPGAGAPVAGAGNGISSSSSVFATAPSSSTVSSSSVVAAAQNTAAAAAAVGTQGLAGTWSSKSNAVFTGPDFYDPVDELLIEPALPGISYSFTEDGYWEEAIYQVSANPQQPNCPSAVLIFQHGKYEVLSNGSLVLTPFEVDGRELVSDPCTTSAASYLRYNQSEFYQSYDIYVDTYHGQWRLDLYEFNGAPYPPMYLAYSPPQMLDTITLNPTAGAAAATASSTSVTQKVRRSLENRSKTTAVRHTTDFTSLWWLSITLVAVGAAGWFFAK